MFAILAGVLGVPVRDHPGVVDHLEKIGSSVRTSVVNDDQFHLAGERNLQDALYCLDDSALFVIRGHENRQFDAGRPAEIIGQGHIMGGPVIGDGLGHLFDDLGDLRQNN
jgi:hypothetical protein